VKIALCSDWVHPSVGASKIGGVPKVTDDGVNGLLFEPWDGGGLSDCVNTLLGAPDLAGDGREGLCLGRGELQLAQGGPEDRGGPPGGGGVTARRPAEARLRVHGV